ncbi:uncharacterized protein EI97DRAFT_459815 [Westerdykella ornata]|uniref:Uncharacterized protein n=1 Tax=Westerdykella ornata TaxID=318751 RepID=A0A6A6JHX0_WESOR|nr:uncharacterized protein EI97DRAFT_459815 [Westerdykella ornata]KAF2274849.1 hypothetical protein EI97DRAFT_459815 [Westerdykella ornata]
MCYALLTHCSLCAWTKRITYPRCAHAELHDLNPQTCPRRMRRRHERGGECEWCMTGGDLVMKNVLAAEGCERVGVEEWDEASEDETEIGKVDVGELLRADGVQIDGTDEVEDMFPGSIAGLGNVVVRKREDEGGAATIPAARYAIRKPGMKRRRGVGCTITNSKRKKRSDDSSIPRVNRMIDEKNRRLSLLPGYMMDGPKQSGIWSPIRQDRRSSWCCAVQGLSALRRPSQCSPLGSLDVKLDPVRRASAVVTM